MRTRHWHGAPVALIDFETDGTDPMTCNPLQVAVYHFNLGAEEAPVEVCNTLIRSEAPIDPGATAVHGITNEMVADAPPVRSVAAMMADLFEGRVVAAYNLSYDWPILRRMLRSAGFFEDVPAFPGLDPLVWNRKMTGRWAGKLVDVCAKYGIVLDGAHAATADALASSRLCSAMAVAMSRQRLIGERTTLGDLIDQQNHWATRQEAEMKAFFEGKGQPFQAGWAACQRLAIEDAIAMGGNPRS